MAARRDGGGTLGGGEWLRVVTECICKKFNHINFISIFSLLFLLLGLHFPIFAKALSIKAPHIPSSPASGADGGGGVRVGAVVRRAIAREEAVAKDWDGSRRTVQAAGREMRGGAERQRGRERRERKKREEREGGRQGDKESAGREAERQERSSEEGERKEETRETVGRGRGKQRQERQRAEREREADHDTHDRRLLSKRDRVHPHGTDENNHNAHFGAYNTSCSGNTADNKHRPRRNRYAAFCRDRDCRLCRPGTAATLPDIGPHLDGGGDDIRPAHGERHHPPVTPRQVGAYGARAVRIDAQRHRTRPCRAGHRAAGIDPDNGHSGISARTPVRELRAAPRNAPAA